MNKQEQELRSLGGWAINIYGSDRRLLCSLNPSHCWSLLTGLLVGMMLAFASIRCEPSRAGSSSEITPNPAPLYID